MTRKKTPLSVVVQVRKLRSEGWKLAELATYFHLGVATASNLCADMGVDLRRGPRSEVQLERLAKTRKRK